MKPGGLVLVSFLRHKILESVSAFEIIEAYPEDKYLPSCLIYSQHEGAAFHVLFAEDVARDHVRIVTTYYPDAEEWEEDFKTRRRSL